MKKTKTIECRSSSDRSEGASHRSSRAAWRRLAVGSLLCATSITWTSAASSGSTASAPILGIVDDIVVAMPTPDGDSDGQTAGSSTNENEAEEYEVSSGARPKLKTKIIPFHPRRRGAGMNVARGGGLCPPVPVTHSDVPWDGTNVELIVQAGLVEQEIAAASFEIDPAEYPITLKSVEMIWSAGSENPSTTITVVWDLWIWRGTPDGGGLLENFPEPSIGADLGGQLPDIVVDPVNPAANVFIQLGESGDEIILTQEDLPDNIVSVGARVLEHHLEPTQDQDCGFGITLPAECVGPVPSFNAFPTTYDEQGIGSVGNEPTMNWLFARPGCGPCAIAGGWYRFSDMGIFQPSGDWNIRLTYQPTECPEDVGACCVDGVCIGDDILNTDCVAQGGDFQGDGVLCDDVDCPVPTGACCYDPGDGTQICENGFTQAQCANESNSLYLGDDSICGPGACDPPTGACCYEQSFGNQVCEVLTEAQCDALPLSNYFGDDTACGPDICIGACCNPDQGTCVATTHSLCEGAGLIWRGEEVDCGSFSCFGVCCMPDGTCENNGVVGRPTEEV